jgi:TRAP-type C4-dicarboxylate transport system substrate-binding protein
MTRPITAILSAAAMLGALAVSGAANAAPEFKLRWGHYLPNTPFVQVEKDYAEAVKAATGGRVEIEITFAGGLGKGGEIMTLAGRGAIDMASVVPGYYADQLLFWKAYQIPFIFNSPRQAMEISGLPKRCRPDVGCLRSKILIVRSRPTRFVMSQSRRRQ